MIYHDLNFQHKREQIVSLCIEIVLCVPNKFSNSFQVMTCMPYYMLCVLSKTKNRLLRRINIDIDVKSDNERSPRVSFNIGSIAI